MEKLQEFVWQLFTGLLVIFFGGWILGIVLNSVAMASPEMVSAVFCPAGSTVTQASAADQSGQNGSNISCHDQDGVYVPALGDGESMALQRTYFYRSSNIIMIILVIGWFIRRKLRNQAN